LAIDGSAVAELHHQSFMSCAEGAVTLELPSVELKKSVLFTINEAESSALEKVRFEVAHQNGAIINYQHPETIAKIGFDLALEIPVSILEKLGGTQLVH